MTKDEIRKKADEALSKIIAEYAEKSKTKRWSQGQFVELLRVEKGLRGNVGENFTTQMLQFVDYGDAKTILGHSSRLQKKGSFDIRANGKRIEVKTASEDVRGKFQFNSIKYNGDTPYDLLFLVGITPDKVFFHICKKEGIPPNLPTMAKNTPGTHKWTLSPDEMHTVEDFAEQANKFLGAPMLANKSE